MVCEYQLKGLGSVHRDAAGGSAMVLALPIVAAVLIGAQASLVPSHPPLLKLMLVAAAFWTLVLLFYVVVIPLLQLASGQVVTDVRLTRTGDSLEVLHKPQNTEWGAIRIVFRRNDFPRRVELTQRFVIPLDECTHVVESRDRFGRYVRFVEPDGYTDLRLPDGLSPGLWSELPTVGQGLASRDLG